MKKTVRLMLFALLAAVLPHTASAQFVMSVYYSGSDTSKSGYYNYETFVSTGSGTELQATIDMTLIPNYTGYNGDYSFWIGKGSTDGQKEDWKMSEAFPNNQGGFTDCLYMSQLYVSIWSDSGDKNYYAHNAYCIDERGCSRPADGSVIPAGTYIFFDNTAGIFTNGIYLAVSTSAHASVEHFDDSYAPSEDTWYTMEQVTGTNYWMAYVTSASPTSRLSFWGSNMYEHGQVWEAKGFYNLAFSSTSATMFVPSAGTDTSDGTKWCYNESRRTYYSTSGSWAAGPVMLSASCSETYIVPDQMSSFELSAQLLNASARSIQWQSSVDGGQTWENMTGATSLSYTVTSGQYTNMTTQYKLVVTYVDGSGVTQTISSNILTVTYDSNCGDEYKEVTVYEMDFGTTTVGASSHPQYPYTYRMKIPDDTGGYSYSYKYADFPMYLNDGYAAIIADPYWCGAGYGKAGEERSVLDSSKDDSGNEYGFLSLGVRNTCEDQNTVDGHGNYTCTNWFRGYLHKDKSQKLRDYTVSQQSDAAGLTYGLCLFINYNQGGDSIAYIHRLTSEEQQDMLPGSLVSLEAYAASPTKSGAETSDVTMAISVQFCAADKDPSVFGNWETEVRHKQVIYHDDDWTRIKTANFELSEKEGLYRIMVAGASTVSSGNDVLIDNIKLVACQPKVDLYFNENGTKSDTLAIGDVTKEHTVEVPEIPSSMFGDNPDVALFVYDENATQKYTYVGMVDQTSSSTTGAKTIKVGITNAATSNYFFDTIPDQIGFVVVATSHNQMGTLRSSIENGTVDPENSTACVRSEKVLIYEIACPSEADVMRFAAGDTTICYSTTIDYPQLNLEFQHVTNDVQFQLTQYDLSSQSSKNIGSLRTITADELTAGKALVNLADYATDLGWVAGGEYEIGANIQEIYNNQTVCSRATTQSVKIEIVPVPDPQLAVEQSVAKCQYQADVKIAVVEAKSEGYTYGYQWQQSVDDGQTFSDISGATSYEYLLPAEASDKTQYRVAMTQTDATAGEGGTTCGPVYSDVVTLTVNDCSELELAQAASVSSLCDGDEITITWTLKNTSQYDNQVKAQVSSSAMPEEFTYVSSTTVSGSGVTGSYDATNRVATMDVSSMARESSVVVAFTYKYTLSTGTLPRTETLQAYVSQKNETTYASYDEQATATMKAASDVTFLAKTTTPITVGLHEECALSTGTYKFADLMAPGSINTNLKWYDADGNVITSETFSLATPGEYKYYVTDTAADQCESDKAEVTVIIHDNTEPLTVSNYNECPADGTLLLADQITSAAGSYTELVWYAADGETVLGDATYSVDKSVTGTTNYYVQAKLNDECPSNLVPLRVNIKDRAIESDISVTDQDLCAGHSATLSASTIISDNNIVFSWYADAELTNRIGTGQSINITVPSVATTYYVTVQGDNTCENLPGDGAELSVTIRPAVTSVTLDPESETIGIGSGTTKTMTVNPSGAAYEHVWTVNDAQVEAAASYTERPYADRRYRVTVSDECDNVYEADATTTVVWPTIITPHNYDGINDDFLTNLGGDIDLVIYDRYGNEVFRGTDGWPTVDAATHLPGIYFYVATLPGGEVKKGTIEIYRTN